MKELITVKVSLSSNIDKAWDYWTNPAHIIKWNFATDEWICPNAENDLTPNGKFSYRMEARDGSMGFNYSGTYKNIESKKLIELNLDDGRSVSIAFSEEDVNTILSETFEPDENDIELQREGWQAILNNFKKYVESN